MRCRPMLASSTPATSQMSFVGAESDTPEASTTMDTRADATKAERAHRTQM